MRSASFRLPRALLPILLAALLSVPAAPAVAVGGADQRSCPNRVTPPPPKDKPEQDPPGPQPTSPLPVPPTPVGGERMSACGPVLPQDAPPLPKQITAASWVVHDLETGAVLAAKAPHARQRPASLIKLLLALVVVREFEPGAKITPTVDDVDTVCSCVGLVAGTHYPVDKLLHGMLMVSGNDAAHAFGTALGGQRAALREMNALAERIGALDTRAATTSGLEAYGMSASAYDVSLIYDHALEQPRIAKILRTKKITFPGGGKKPDYPIYNDNDLLGTYPGFFGGKTGYTDDARHTYVGGARRNGTSLGVVLLRGEQRPIRLAEQAARLLDYGFALAARGSRPLGTVVESSPPQASTTTREALESRAAGTASATTASARSSDTTASIVTLIAALAIVTLLFTRLRRRTPASRD